MIGDIVIEFQHSKISPEEFYKRNEFYHSIGKYIIWVFDVTGKVDYDVSGACRGIEECQVYCLKTNSLIFRGRDCRKSADMIFLCDNEEYGDDDFYLMQASWWWIANGKRSAKVIFGIEREFENSEFVDILLGNTQIDCDTHCGPIPYIWRKNHIKNEAIFENKGGYRVRITSNPVDIYEKYGRLYGNFAAPGNKRFNQKSKQVYYGMDDWKLISYK